MDCQEVGGLGVGQGVQRGDGGGAVLQRGESGSVRLYFTLDITPKATGQRVTREEVAVYTVNKEDKITREQFFYDGEH